MTISLKQFVWRWCGVRHCWYRLGFVCGDRVSISTELIEHISRFVQSFLMNGSKTGMQPNCESVAIANENYGRSLAKLKRQGKDESEEYKAMLENYMRKSCELMCTKYESVVSSSLLELEGTLLMSKVIPDVLLKEVYDEVLSCVGDPVAITQSQLQVFMHEVPGNIVGQVGLEEGVDGDNPCKLLNIFLKEGLGVLWPRHKYCKILLLQTDSIGIDEWKDCTFHLDYSGETLEKIASKIPAMRPVFMIMPFGEHGTRLDVGYRGSKLPKSFRSNKSKAVKKGNILVVSTLQWHRTAKPSAVEEIDFDRQKGTKRLKERRKVCLSDLRLHICIGPEEEHVNPHEATVVVEK